MTCAHRFRLWFGPVMKCGRCGASTMASMDPKESKPIFPPEKYVEPTDG
jgi:hypothetical protein